MHLKLFFLIFAVGLAGVLAGGGLGDDDDDSGFPCCTRNWKDCDPANVAEWNNFGEPVTNKASCEASNADFPNSPLKWRASECPREFALWQWGCTKNNECCTSNCVLWWDGADEGSCGPPTSS